MAKGPVATGALLQPRQPFRRPRNALPPSGRRVRGPASDEEARPPKTVSVSAMSPEATIAAFVGHELHVLEAYEKELEAVAKRWADGNFRVMPGEVRPGDVEIRELETKD